MATTVGATLASSKLVVTQDDLHLVGSPVNQLVLCFDQVAFDEFLATARGKTSKAGKRHRETRAAGPQCAPAASSPHGNLPAHRGRAPSVSDDGPISTSVWSRIRRPTGKAPTLGGSSCPQHGSHSVNRRVRRRRAVERLELSQRPLHHCDIPRSSSRHGTQAGPISSGAQATLVPPLSKGVKPRAAGCTSAIRYRGEVPSAGISQHVRRGVKARRAAQVSPSCRRSYPQEDKPHEGRMASTSSARGSPRRRSGSSTPESPRRRSVFDRLSPPGEPRPEKRRRPCSEVVSVNVITRSRYRSGSRPDPESLPPRIRQSRANHRLPATSEAHSALADSDTVDSAAENEMTTYMVADARPSASSPPGPQEPLPKRTEETIRHLADSVAHLTEQLQTMQERLDRQSQEYEQIRSAHPSPTTQDRPISPREKSPIPPSREDQREVPASATQPPGRQGQARNISPGRKEKAITVDSEPEANPLRASGQKRQAHQRQRIFEDSEECLYYSDDPISPKRATTREVEAFRRLEKLERWAATASGRLEIQGSEITRPYPPEWDAEPYPKGFKVPALHSFDGTQLASQHIYHFKSLTGSVSNNEAMMTRLFFGTLQGVAFEWFKHLRPGCIKSWNDLERRFLHRFPDCDLEVSSVTLASIKQKEGEPIREYIERFRRTAGRTRGGLPQKEQVEFCRQGLKRDVRHRFGVTPIATWEEMTQAGDRAELEIQLDLEDQPPRSDQRGRGRGNGRDSHAAEAQYAPDYSAVPPPRLQRGNRPPPVYSFNDASIEPIFELLQKAGKIRPVDPPPRPDQVGMTDDPRYCIYHRSLSHPTVSCWALKERIETLVQAGVLTLEPKQRRVSTNATATIVFGRNEPVALVQVNPIPQVEMTIINADPHRQKEKGLVPVNLTNGEVCWVHPDLVEDDQPWAPVVGRKAKAPKATAPGSKPGNKKATHTSNALTAFHMEKDDDCEAMLTDSEEGLTAPADNPVVAATRSGRNFGYEYPEEAAAAPPSQPAGEPVEANATPAQEPPETTAKKQKHLRFSSPLLPSEAGQPTTVFRFDILKQLAQIPARITLLELLKLSKATREALREALANADTFATHIFTKEALTAINRASSITFSDEDLQVRGMHDRPLYFTGYIGSTVIARIQVDQGSALSIMPLRILSYLMIPRSRLSATNTIIAGFNANSSTPLGKIRLNCRIGDLKTEVTCYIIDADTSYNLLLGRPWLHRNGLIPSSLHQVVKYIDQEGRLCTLKADSNPFKGVENYFTDAVHYQETMEAGKEAAPENGAAVESDPETPWYATCEEGTWYVND